MDIPIISPIFGFIIKGLYNVFGQNYLLTLFMFALVMKVLLLPFGIKQQKNSIKQSKLRPKEMAIRNKYKGRTDKATQQKMSEEIMKLYQEENVNPMSGCLPMLIQLPILFALYGVIIKPLTYISSIGKSGVTAITNAIETVNKGLEAAGQAVIKLTSTGEIPLMRELLSGEHAQSIKDVLISNDASWTEKIAEMGEINSSFNILGVDLTANASLTVWPLLLIPILTFAFSFLSTKVIRKFTYQPAAATGDPSQKASMGMMDWMMPLLSVWISLSIPAAIAIYWIFQNILSALQQILLFKLYPVPPVTEEMIKEAELQLKGKSKKTKQVVLSDDDIDDYDKTVTTDKSGSNKKKDGIMSSRKAGISPKVKTLYKNGTRLHARKKI